MALQPVETDGRRSRGERWFDFIVYGPVAFVGSFVASAALAVLQKRKAPYIHENVVDGLQKIGVSSKIAEASAPVLLTSWGGTLMVPVIKFAENRKEAIIRGINRFTHDDTPVDQAAIDATPKQTWPSLILGRIGTILLVWPMMSVAHALGGDTFAKAENGTGSALARWLKKPTHTGVPAGIEAERDALLALKKAAVEKKGTFSAEQGKQLGHVLRTIERHETVPFSLGRMLAVDAVVTVVSVVGLYALSHLFARKEEEHKEKKHERQEALALPRIEAPVRVAANEDKPQTKVQAASVSDLESPALAGGLAR